MKLKQWISLLLLLALLLSATACKDNTSSVGSGDEDEIIETTPLSDDEFFGAPDLIVRATVNSVRKQYFTNPDGDPATNAHITVQDIMIHEVYKGNLGDELPPEFLINLYDGEGLSTKDYGNQEQLFYLNQGEEYILGISFLTESQDPYGNGGGYVIQGKRLWTFRKTEDGFYENLEQGVNHKKLDVETLKQKLVELSIPDPQPQPEPLYKTDGIQKDPAITDALREQFFKLYRDWRVDAMYEFTPEKPMELEWFKYYCAYFVTDQERSYTDMGVNYTGAAVERIAERFGTTYGLKDDDMVFVKAGSLRSIPFAELIQYRKETVNGQTVVTARCINYSFTDYQYSTEAEIEASESYETRKEGVLQGNGADYDYFTIDDFSFLTEDGLTPTRFLSCMTYSPESLADGYQTLPDFKNVKAPVLPDTAPKKTVTFSETPKLERIGDGIFYYGVENFYPTVDGKNNTEFRALAKDDPLAGYNLTVQGKKDEENKLCKHSESYETVLLNRRIESWQYSEYSVSKVSAMGLTYYVIGKPDLNGSVSFDQMILMNTPDDSAIVRTIGRLKNLNDYVYYYQIQAFRPTIDGKQVDFAELLKTDSEAVEKLLKQADRDAENKLCQKLTHKDGGTVQYDYKDYTIVKYHALNSKTEDPDDYLEALVIGPGGADYQTAYEMIFNGMSFR